MIVSRRCGFTRLANDCAPEFSIGGCSFVFVPRRNRRGRSHRITHTAQGKALTSGQPMSTFCRDVRAAPAPRDAQGKSATRLFADGCATCHHNARGLAKGRFSLTLFLFLQDHYATNSSSAWALTSYLESVDGPARSRLRAAASKRSSPTLSTSPSRPPRPVPER